MSDDQDQQADGAPEAGDDATDGGDFGLETTERAHREAEEQRYFLAETSEGAQELLPRGTTGSEELRTEVGAVLRLPEGGFVDPGDIDIERRDDQTMIINMGPQHPSTHGVLRLMLELDGETVLRTKPIIGYLHTGMEKTGEELTYVQGATNTTRMDYLSPLHNELVFSLATEALLGVELPPRATWIRMLMCELNRVSSHLLWMATNGLDLGSTSMMIYGFREPRDGAQLLREDDGPSDEPQLHPARGVWPPTCPTAGRTTSRSSARRCWRAASSTTSCSRDSPSSGSGPRRSATSRPRRRSPSR